MNSLAEFEATYQRYKSLSTTEQEELKKGAWEQAKKIIIGMDRNYMIQSAAQAPQFVEAINQLFKLYDFTGLSRMEAHKIYSDALMEAAAVLSLMLKELNLIIKGSGDIH
jgi:hypothetical protein